MAKGVSLLDLDDVLLEWAEGVISKIRSNMEAQNINASGETSKSLEAVLTDDGIMILGAPYFAERTEIGRTPTIHKQSFDFVSIIKQWIDDKGLRSKFGIDDERDLASVASGIVHNITTLGSAKYRGDMPMTDVYSSVVEQSVSELGEKVLLNAYQRLEGILEKKI